MMTWQMCSEEEGRDRELHFDVHVLEATDETKQGPTNSRKIDSRRAVRKFIRSGSDNLQCRYPARSLASIQYTVTYLIQCWYLNSTETSSESDIAICYHFVMDRVNAVRQEVVSKQIKGTEALNLLNSIVRLYLNMGCRCRQLLIINRSKSVKKDDWYDSIMHDNAITSCIIGALSNGNEYKLDMAGGCASDNEIAYIMEELTCYLLLQRTFQHFMKVVEQVVHSNGTVSLFNGMCFPDILTSMKAALEYFPGMNPLFSMICQFIGACLRGSNPSKAISIIYSLEPRTESVMPAKGIPANGSSNALRSLPIMSLLHRFLPGLALWRLLLIECSANRGEVVSLAFLGHTLGIGRTNAAFMTEQSVFKGNLTDNVVLILAHMGQDQEGGSSSRIICSEENQPILCRLRTGSQLNESQMKAILKSLELIFIEQYPTLTFDHWFPQIPQLKP